MQSLHIIPCNLWFRHCAVKNCGCLLPDGEQNLNGCSAGRSTTVGIAVGTACYQSELWVCSQIARALAGIYLVIQIFTILEFVYTINEWLLEKSWGFVLITGTALMYGGGIAVVGVLYHYFAPHGWCHLNIFFITWTVVLGFAYSFISVSHSLALQNVPVCQGTTNLKHIHGRA